MAAAASPREALATFFRTYAPVEADWAFQLWLDAWAEAARRPAVRSTSARLNLAWQGLLERTIVEGVAAGDFRCADPAAAAWRILSLLDGLALQVVAHRTTLGRPEVMTWATAFAEAELGLAGGTLDGGSGGDRAEGGSRRGRSLRSGGRRSQRGSSGRSGRETDGPARAR